MKERRQKRDMVAICGTRPLAVVFFKFLLLHPRILMSTDTMMRQDNRRSYAIWSRNAKRHAATVPGHCGCSWVHGQSNFEVKTRGNGTIPWSDAGTVPVNGSVINPLTDILLQETGKRAPKERREIIGQPSHRSLSHLTPITPFPLYSSL